jgi:hypothetical protein
MPCPLFVVRAALFSLLCFVLVAAVFMLKGADWPGWMWDW